VLTRAHEGPKALWQAIFGAVSHPTWIRAELAAVPVLRLAALPAQHLPSGRFYDRFSLDPEVPDANFAQAFFGACEKLTQKPTAE
jgi:hypothetical protein